MPGPGGIRAFLTSEWPGVDPGHLRHELTFLNQTYVTDSSGVSTTWVASSPPVTAAAKMEAISGEEIIKAGLDVSQLVAKFTMRYQDAIVAEMRFTTEQQTPGTAWIIKYIEDVQDRHVLLKLICLGLGDNR